MARYNAAKERAAGRMTHDQITPKSRMLLGMLEVPYPPGSPHGERLLDRTAVKIHYRLAPGLARVFGITVCDIPDIVPDNPLTELATVHDTLSAIDRFVNETDLDPKAILANIRERLAEPTQEEAPVLLAAAA